MSVECDLKTDVRCRRCRRALTNPDSRAKGYGPSASRERQKRDWKLKNWRRPLLEHPALPPHPAPHLLPASSQTSRRHNPRALRSAGSHPVHRQYDGLSRLSRSLPGDRLGPVLAAGKQCTEERSLMRKLMINNIKLLLKTSKIARTSPISFAPHGEESNTNQTKSP